MALQLWAEVFDASDSKLGIVTLRQVSISRGLDEAGTITLSPFFGEKNATDLLDTRRLVTLYWEHPIKGKTQIGRGLLLQQSGDLVLGDLPWTGMDQMEELRAGNTLRGLIYDDEDLVNIVQDLLDEVSGWSVKKTSGLGTTSRRFDGASILEAVRTVVSGVGLHFRQIGERRVEIGTFGADSGLRISNLPAGRYEAHAQSKLAIMTQPLQLVYDGHDIVNWVEPVWGGGDAVLTLKRSTRTSPYPIQTTTGPNGKTVYYLQHAASIAQYGTVKAVDQMQDTPYIAADATVMVNAANLLYDWEAARLTRRAYPQTTYSVSGIKLDMALLAGDKVRLVYKGEIIDYAGRTVRYAEIDDDFWVMRISENYDEGGQTWTVELCNVDQQVASDTDLLSDMVMALSAQTIGRRLSAQNNRYEDEGTVSRIVPLEIDFTIAAATVDIGDAILTVTRADSTGPNGVYVEVDGTLVGSTQMIDNQADNSFQQAIDDVLTDEDHIDDLQGDHTVAIKCSGRSGTITAVLEIVEVGLSAD